MISAHVPFSPAFRLALALLLALTHAILAWTATAEKSVTADEIAHLTAGYTYNRWGDFRLQPENGNLPQRWAALPAMLLQPPLPSPQSMIFQTGDVWTYSRIFFFESGVSSDLLLYAGRGMIALLSATLALAIFFWSRKLFGERGAFLSLALYCFCPNFLAHGALTTSDLAAALFLLLAVGAWSSHLERPGAAGATASVAALGLATVAKFSAPLLAPMFVLIATAWLAWSVPAGARWRATLRLGRTVVVHLVGALAIVWLFYNCRFDMGSPEINAVPTITGDFPSLLRGTGLARHPIEWSQTWHILPEAFLYGLTFVLHAAQARAAFLNGDYSLQGWPEFFPYAFLVKTTLPLLALLMLALVLAARRGTSEWQRRLWQASPLLALFLVYWAVSIASHLNIGHRHILPTYPVLFIALGSLGIWFARRSAATAAVVLALTAAHIATSLQIRPHYLAFFNSIAGGPDNGWRHLVDSSLDWGQDLPGLKHWLDGHARGERVYHAYFGTGEPGYEGIHATPLPSIPGPRQPHPWHPLESGVYAIGATMLQHVYSSARGDWTLEREREYQKLRVLEPTLLEYQRSAAHRAEMRAIPDAQWTATWGRYEQLRFARLCYFLRVRPADAMIGHSILVFRLSAGEIHGATGGSLADWRRLIERAAAAGTH